MANDFFLRLSVFLVVAEVVTLAFLLFRSHHSFRCVGDHALVHLHLFYAWVRIMNGLRKAKGSVRAANEARKRRRSSSGSRKIDIVIDAAHPIDGPPLSDKRVSQPVERWKPQGPAPKKRR